MTDVQVAQAYNRLSKGLMGWCLQRGLFRDTTEVAAVMEDFEMLGQYLKDRLVLDAPKSDLTVVPKVE